MVDPLHVQQHLCFPLPIMKFCFLHCSMDVESRCMPIAPKDYQYAQGMQTACTSSALTWCNQLTFIHIQLSIQHCNKPLWKQSQCLVLEMIIDYSVIPPTTVTTTYFVLRCFVVLSSHCLFLCKYLVVGLLSYCRKQLILLNFLNKYLPQ